MKIVSSNYVELKRSVPDREIHLREVFSEAALEELTAAYAPFAEGFTPIIGTIGEALICIGNTEENRGRIVSSPTE